MTNVIFDFNGTLFPDMKIHRYAWEVFFKSQGLPFTDDLFYKYMCGPPNREILLRLVKEDLTDEEIDTLSEQKESIYRQIVLDDPKLQKLTPGAEEMLDMLAEKGVPFAIATGSNRKNCDFYFRALGIGKWFTYDNVFYTTSAIPGKPDPAIYRLAMQKLGFKPEESIVVEDARDGIVSALSAGVKAVIAIDNTMPPDVLSNIPGVSAVIHDLYGFERFL